MFSDFIAFLVATFLIGPLQSEMASRLADGQAPAAVVQQMTRCATDATPLIFMRAGGDPWWAITTAVGAWIGTTAPETVLRETAPSCAGALDAARPFLAQS